MHVVGEQLQQARRELELGRELADNLEHAVEPLREDRRRLLLVRFVRLVVLLAVDVAQAAADVRRAARVARELVHVPLGELVPEAAELLLDEDAQAADGAEVRVHQDHREARGLRRAVPAVGAVGQDGLALRRDKLRDFVRGDEHLLNVVQPHRRVQLLVEGVARRAAVRAVAAPVVLADDGPKLLPRGGDGMNVLDAAELHLAHPVAATGLVPAAHGHVARRRTLRAEVDHVERARDDGGGGGRRRVLGRRQVPVAVVDQRRRGDEARPRRDAPRRGLRRRRGRGERRCVGHVARLRRDGVVRVDERRAQRRVVAARAVALPQHRLRAARDDAAGREAHVRDRGDARARAEDGGALEQVVAA
mmetsp:Transcript_54309/g.167121  ORF Transcript_54309/g.167121 Transcript_54309/m.167121 type:complete len:363 (-) Transcript_54309:284-1372(-)